MNNERDIIMNTQPYAEDLGVCDSKGKATVNAPVQNVVHTPGPWEVKGPSQNGHCRRIFAGDEYVGIVGGSDQPMRTIRANADLVAAAPDLLAACREMIEAMDDYGCSVDDPPTEKHRQIMLRAMSAVEKATYQVV